MNTFLTIILYAILGFASGIFGGLGMGGGTLLIPLLNIFLGLDQKLCQGINLVSFLVMALFSLIIHFKNGYVQTKGIFYIIISGLALSLLGSFLAGALPSEILKISFGVFLCILSVVQFAQTISRKGKKDKNKGK